MSKKILAVIPARGGSKGLPNKNIKLLNGKPLIAWTIESAISSKYINRVIVSTDSEDIAKIAIQYGAEVPFLRPGELAKDDTPSILPILHMMEYLEKNEEYLADYVILLQCTSPLRKSFHIDESIEQLLSSKEKYIVSVTSLEHPMEWIRKINKQGYLETIFHNNENKHRRQDYETMYRLNGAIYAGEWNAIKMNKGFIISRTLAYIMKNKDSIDIDNIEDFNLAEYYIKINGK